MRGRSEAWALRGKGSPGPASGVRVSQGLSFRFVFENLLRSRISLSGVLSVLGTEFQFGVFISESILGCPDQLHQSTDVPAQLG